LWRPVTFISHVREKSSSFHMGGKWEVGSTTSTTSTARGRDEDMRKTRTYVVILPPDRLFDGLDASELVKAETVLSAYQARGRSPGALFVFGDVGCRFRRRLSLGRNHDSDRSHWRRVRPVRVRRSLSESSEYCLGYPVSRRRVPTHNRYSLWLAIDCHRQRL
jgi:hypothetical protein